MKEKKENVAINIEAVSKFNFAADQNSVALIGFLEIHNRGDKPLASLRLEMRAKPMFVEPKSWNIERLSVDEKLPISDRDVLCQKEKLQKNTESVSGILVFKLYASEGGNEKCLATQKRPVQWLAFNEWGGCNTMPELLAAFVTPNDPEIIQILKKTKKLLDKQYKEGSVELSGYCGNDRKKVWSICAAIWEIIKARKLTYLMPPASYENEGQKVRLPSTAWQEGVATCLDSSLLFAAALEQAGLHPMLILVKGHAFVGVWLQEEEFSNLIVEEPSSIRKYIDLKDLVVFESTLALDKKKDIKFSDAISNARDWMFGDNDNDFVMALDIKRARIQQYKPISQQKAEIKPGIDSGKDSIPPTLELPPDFPDPDILPGEKISVENESPDEREERWKRLLLDMSARNPLLNCKSGKAVLPLLCEDPAVLEDQLAQNKVFKFKGLENNSRDPQIHEGRHGVSLDASVVKEAINKREIIVKLEEADMEARLIKLYRKASLDIQEGGANTLYIVFGFLVWKRIDKRRFRAPLIMVPVVLSRQSVKAGIKLRQHGDETRMNSTLLQMLRQDFELEIPGLNENDLPKDEHGIDVAKILNMVQMAVKECDGFEVTKDVLLGSFSFSKYLMWNVLDKSIELLKESAVVEHLINTPRDPWKKGGNGFVESRQLDKKLDPKDFLAPLPADSSQLACIVAAEKGESFVLEGPPGTGKSQTISNMIVHLLGKGKKILFVSEKIAALNVVHSRLKKLGMDQACLELHSKKTNKKEVLEHLRKSWEQRNLPIESEWRKNCQDLKDKRDHLNDYVKQLHYVHQNGWTVYHAMGIVWRKHGVKLIKFSWDSGVKHNEQDMLKMTDLAKRFKELPEELGELFDTMFSLVYRERWTPAWRDEMAKCCSELTEAYREMINAASELLSKLSLDISIMTLGKMQDLSQFGDDLPQVTEILPFVLRGNSEQRLQQLHDGIEWIRKIEKCRENLSVSYREDAYQTIDIASLKEIWIKGMSSNWLKRFFVSVKVRKAMKIQGGTNAKPDPEKDIPLLDTMSKLQAKVDELGLESWKGIHPDVPKLEKLALHAKRVIDFLQGNSDDIQTLMVVKKQILDVSEHAVEALQEHGVIKRSIDAFKAIQERFSNQLKIFYDLADVPGDIQKRKQTEAVFFSNFPDYLTLLANQKDQLNQWCQWLGFRRELREANLQDLIKPYESGDFATEDAADFFEWNYASWWLEGLCENAKDNFFLVKFSAQKHESRIGDFRSLDESLASLVPKHVNAEIFQHIPSLTEVTSKSGFGIIKKEMMKKMRHMPLRKLMEQTAPDVLKLTPCLLMSPLSVAQYLPENMPKFDVVIFDEASQIKTEDAIGSLGWGRQAIVCGDSKQLPPTRFFLRSEGEEEEMEETEVQEVESILDEMIAANIPRRSLLWHYRSKHESLIAFSNWKYYDNKLITFPSPVTSDRAVIMKKIPGHYDRGKSKTNRKEAEAIVEEICVRLSGKPKDSDAESIGVITVNSQQQKLIEDLLDAKRNEDPSLEPHFSENAYESVFVKNIETVQGDERDVCFFSITYGKDKAGYMTMNFGALNREGGERRLNVAVTRARSEMKIFSSLDPDDIDVSRTKAKALRDLKEYLKYSTQGISALVSADRGSQGECESPFEEEVADQLRRRNWIVHPQVGVSNFRIDFGIVHPENPGKYLCGVECDGATYHSSATAKDRDIVRENVLRGIGWTLVRIWSTDFWRNPTKSMDKVHAKLEKLLEISLG
ncbi:MAG: DUF4011 domain-containing protein [Candidatus Eutrophobiaceae bacterium]